MTKPGKTIEAGDPNTLGARFDGEGTHFALYSAHAEAVELCIHDARGEVELERLFLPEQTHGVWHGFVPGLRPGASYGYRVHGPYAPEQGHRFNPAKLLLDPCAKEIAGAFQQHSSHFGYQSRDSGREPGGEAGHPSLAHPPPGTMTGATGAHPSPEPPPDTRDNAAYMPKAVVTAPGTSPGPRRRPLVPWPETVIYECHVKGFTRLHPDVPEAMRGTFAGLSQPRVIEYLQALGVTSVELMPVHAFISEFDLRAKGLVNYWGYNSLSFFLPHPAYGAAAEFRAMVDRFHDAGLEVILDVVYNHTCEGDHRGPTLSFKGIDNRSYYQLGPDDPRRYINDSGCGNTLNIRHPQVLRLVMDSLRYWAGTLGVDGFRFDLAAILGRRESGFDPAAPFFQALAQDPALAGIKLIAEPWDIGPGGYRLGGFPAGWSEWNDRYRDTIRRFWRGDAGLLPEMARRLHGSGDLFEASGRRPWAGVNFAAAHDGFTLRDLASYEQRHNEANLEGNRDGHGSNFSDNHGVEGPTNDAEIDTRRWRRQRNLLATLAVSQGVPMLAAGDEFGRSQAGNNNTWCQDNRLNWIDWEAVTPQGRELRNFTRELLALRRRFAALRADRYRHRPTAAGEDGIQWLNSAGTTMRDEHWHDPELRVFGYLLAAGEAGNADGGENGERTRHLLVLFNGGKRAADFRLPAEPAGGWCWLLHTATPTGAVETMNAPANGSIDLPAQSIAILGNRAAEAEHDKS